MNLLRATRLYQSFRDITNTPEGPETHCEKKIIAFGVKRCLGFRSAPGPLRAVCALAVPWEGVGCHHGSLPSHPLHGAVVLPVTSNEAVLGLCSSEGLQSCPQAARVVEGKVFPWMPFLRWCPRLLCVFP